MLQRGMASIQEAFDSGRTHTQRFVKTVGGAFNFNGAFVDCSFASGQPAYDARVGIAGAFTPVIASGNDAVYFPPIPSTMSRHLVSMDFRMTPGANNASIIVADILGYYPLIDGDSDVVQEFTNSNQLPRYATGEGVIASIVSNIAPAVSVGTATINFTGSDGVDRTSGVFYTGIGNSTQAGVISNTLEATGATFGSLGIPTNNSAGVRAVNSLTYSIPPGGIHCLYLWRPICTLVTNTDCVTEKFFFGNGGLIPRVYDGASLNVFKMHTAVVNHTPIFGSMTFIWN